MFFQDQCNTVLYATFTFRSSTSLYIILTRAQITELIAEINYILSS